MTTFLRKLRANAVLLTVTAIGVAGGLVLGASTGRTNWLVYFVVVLVGLAIVAGLHVRYGLSTPTRIGLALFALGHVAGGMVPVGDGVLYGYWLVDGVVRYDNVQHALGFGVAGRATWECLRGRLGPAARDPWLMWWLVVLGAAAFGAINEIIEWILTLTIPGTDVGGYDNTARDLVANTVGGLAVGALTVWESRRDRS